MLFAAPVMVCAADVHPGDSLNDVISALGAPKSREQLGDKLVLFYDNGKVQLVDGRVTKSDMPAAQPHEIQPGDSLADVKAFLGAPKYKEKLGNKLILSYDRGKVELTDGRVTSINLLSPEDLAAQQARRAAEAAQAAQLKAQHIAEGGALKAKKLADPAFTSAPLADQLAFWQDFRRQYPEVPCDNEYNSALARQQQIAEQEGPQPAAAQQPVTVLPETVYGDEHHHHARENDFDDTNHRPSPPRIDAGGNSPTPNAGAASPFQLPKITTPPSPVFNNPVFPTPKSPTFTLPNMNGVMPSPVTPSSPH